MTEQKPKPDKYLRASHITKSYPGPDGKLEVLRDLNLTLTPGITGLAGPSGTGKTTLLNLLAGLTAPDAGTIERGAGNIGYVFQENRLLPWRTVEGNLRFVMDERNRREREKNDREIDRVLAMCRLDEKKEAYPAELSGGMQRRLALARALVNRPDYLFLDEPFTGLDEGLIRELTEDIKRIVREAGILAIAVSHQIEALEALCDRVLRLEDLMGDGAQAQEAPLQQADWKREETCE